MEVCSENIWVMPLQQKTQKKLNCQKYYTAHGSRNQNGQQISREGETICVNNANDTASNGQGKLQCQSQVPGMI